MVVPVATSASISRVVSRSSSGASITDDLENVILNESSRRINSEQGNKGTDFDSISFSSCGMLKDESID